ncbi:hypothetical protein JCM10213_003596 [Rhodosporidiobolus nylandii]
MPPRPASGPSTPRRTQPSPPPTALEGGIEQLAHRGDLAPRDQQQPLEGQYQAGSPIRFYVQRMHTELDKRAGDERIAARRALRVPARRRKQGVTVTGFFLRVAVFYLLIAVFLVCPTDTTRERAVCRQLDSFSSRVKAYEPFVRPYYLTARRKVAPYVAEMQHVTEPYVAKIRPHYLAADSFLRPHLSRAARTYNGSVHPRLVAGVHRSQAMTKPYVDRAKKQYTKTLQPSVEWYAEALGAWYAAKVEPHVSQVTSTASKYGRTAYGAVSPVYTRGVPLVKHHYRAHVLPFSRSAYRTSRRTYVKHVHPRALTLGKHSAAFYRTRVLPALQRFWSRFVDPQLDKIRERIFEYKAKKARQEAVERVEKKTQEIVKDAGEDDIEDFINDLRDAKLPPSASNDHPVDAALPDDAPPAYSSSVPPPPPSPEEAAAQTAEKRAALSALQTTYEQEIAALGQAEQRLLVDRLAAIREHALKDIPARFDASLEKLDEEGDKMVGRLGKYFDRAAEDERLTVDEKVKDADFLCSKATLKVRKMADKVKVEVDEYRKELEGKETAAVEKAQQAVGELVAKAQSELGVGWTWLEDVTAKDWQRYHSLRKAEQNLHNSFASLQSGAIKDGALTSLNPRALLNEYEKKPDVLVDAFVKILDKIKVKGQRELKGEWLGVVPEAQKAYDSVSGKFGAVVADLKESASSVAGIEKKPANVAQSVSSMAKAAQASASSVAQDALNALPTIEAHQEYLAAAKAAYGDASQNVLRAVGVQPSPTDLQQTATSLALAASASAAYAYAKASQSALRAVGREPSPTDLAQSLTSIGNVASASAAAAYSQVLSDYPSSISSALAAATQAVDQAAEDALSSASSLAASAASVVSSLAAPAATMLSPAPIVDVLEGAAERANEFFGDISQGALEAVGVQPSPTDVKQSATSIVAAASSSLSSVASRATPAADYTRSLRSSASSAGAGVKSSLSSLSSAASQAVHDATRTTAEGAAETASSLASVLSSGASSLGQPHASFAKSQGKASVQSGAAAVSASASSLSSAASQAVHDATRTTAEGVKETLASVLEKVKSEAAPHSSFSKSSVVEQVVKATEKAKSVVHGEL